MPRRASGRIHAQQTPARVWTATFTGEGLNLDSSQGHGRPRTPARTRASAARVLIVWDWMPDYRVAFFERLRHVLDANGVALTVAYGDRRAQLAGGHASDLSWGVFTPVTSFAVGGLALEWQSCLRLAAAQDLVVVEQAARLILNHALQARRLLAPSRMAFWGHGANLQHTSANHAAEVWKRMTVRHVDWWFAYTDATASLVASHGYPAARITVLNNAFDTDPLHEAAVLPGAAASARAEFGISPSAHVAAYCGGLHREKRIDVVLEAARQLRERVADFHLLILGTGPLEEMVRRTAHSCPWIHYIGPVMSEERGRYLAAASVLMIPAAVGLVALDSFATETPLVAIAGADHGPEISYLEPDVNGVVVAARAGLDGYVRAVERVLLDSSWHAALQAGCERSRTKYSLDDMVTRFAEGTLACLQTARYPVTLVRRR